MSDSPDAAAKKKFPDCARILSLDEFHSDRRRPDGRSFYCRSCARVRNEASRRRRGISAARRPEVPVAPGNKWCPDCGETKSVEDFPRTRAKTSGLHSYCKPCHTLRTRETATRLYGGFREYHLRHRYGIGEEAFQEMLLEQGGCCAICHDPNPDHVDHDHVTGEVRGILCFNCNGGLGQFRDDRELLARAIEYLKGRRDVGSR
ncbi:MAG: recombinase [Hamadaea sp.]|nr:endonuclease VII domain-containing protein [Hamadaea sp.]NUR74533.1 recombinase [Hamadaea sp.]NUT18329.1 recombinase [Hamadaea sp.]